MDITYFRQLHSDACAKLDELCVVWDQKTALLEQDDTGSITEDGEH